MTHQEIGYHILRLGLGAMFLWFGFSQLFDAVNWVGWVPEWAVNLLHLPPAMIVLLNGSLEVIGGSLLVLGLLVRPVAAILAAHLAIIAFEIGLNDIGARDWGLATAMLALMFLIPEKEEISVVSRGG